MGRKPRISRDLILASAIKIIARVGFEDASFQQIADDCKVSQSAVIHYFPNKLNLIEEILKNVVTHNTTEVRESLTVHDNAYQRLQKHFVGNLTWAVKSPAEAQVILLLYYLATHKRQFTDMYEKILAAARGRILEIVAAGQREKIFHLMFEEATVVELLHDALLGGIVNTVATRKGKIEIEAIAKKWEKLFSALLGVNGH